MCGPKVRPTTACNIKYGQLDCRSVLAVVCEQAHKARHRLCLKRASTVNEPTGSCSMHRAPINVIPNKRQ